MKKPLWLLFFAAVILAALCVCSAGAEAQLPAEIREALSGREILQAAYWESPGSTWFVLVRIPDGTNMLLCFELHDGAWIQSFHTIAAVPQGKVGVERLYITDKMQDFVNNRTWPGPILLILVDDGGYYSYQRSDSGQWNLFRVFYLEEQVHLDFDDESVTYRTPIDQDHSRIETVQGTFERDLRKVDVNSIPRSPQQAQEMLEENGGTVPSVLSGD